jgi:hypothetical protein
MKKIIFILLLGVLSACATKPAQYKAVEEGKWFSSRDGYKDERLADGTHRISVFYDEGADREKFFAQRAAEICGGEGKYMVSEKAHRTNSITSYAYTGMVMVPIQTVTVHLEGVVACVP